VRKSIAELCSFVSGLFGGGKQPSNTVKIGAFSISASMLCVAALYSMAMIAEDNELTRLIVQQLGEAINAVCALGGYATVAKGGKDAVAAYASGGPNDPETSPDATEP